MPRSTLELPDTKVYSILQTTLEPPPQDLSLKILQITLEPHPQKYYKRL
ncbi:hypothetical protein [Chroococcidiopsis cubana]|nr:hypothetical protein [Chroococcidiopsis cubana]